MKRRDFNKLCAGAVAGIVGVGDLPTSAARPPLLLHRAKGEFNYAIDPDQMPIWRNHVTHTYDVGLCNAKLYLKNYDPETKTLTLSYTPTLEQEFYEFWRDTKPAR